MAVAVYRAEEVAELLDLSPWAVYSAVKRQEAPLGTLAIRCGRRLVWPKAAVNRLLQLDDEPTVTPRPGTT
jgi:predicted DNA-binding transcriptional regulator AlpA